MGALLLGASASLADRDDHTHSHSMIHDLDPFVVDATLAPRSSRDMLTPASVLASDELEQNLSGTIGEVLDGQPGIHATAFGAGASRPVIRGLEGNRLRVMERGVDSGDLSADSPDHAVAIEPFFIDRIEVLRGASTLPYGSSAIGGVVNVLDKRIPRELPDGSAPSFQGIIDYQSAADGWTTGGLVAVSVEDFVVSVSYLERDHNDYSIPGYAELETEHDHEEDHDHDEPQDEQELRGTLENSFLEVSTGSAAVSWFPTELTRITLAWIYNESHYGVPGHMHGEDHDEEDEGEEHHEDDHDDGHDEHALEEGVAIDLNQSSVDLEFEHQLKGSFFESLEGRIRYIDYDHQELEGDELGTNYEKESVELRLLATYLLDDSGPGAVGFNALELDSIAVGEESLTPPSGTRDLAVFLLQEWNLQNLRIEGGLRLEQREIDADATDGYSGWAISGSIGAKWSLDGGNSLGVLFNRAQRHPVATELFADGPHAATRRYEIGDSVLGKESANGLDVSFHHHADAWSGSLTTFYTRFSDFIFAAPTDEEADSFRVYQYTRADADFRGFEGELTWHAWHAGSGFFDLRLLADYVETDLRTSPDDLPGIPPMRIGAGMHFGTDRWTVRTMLSHSFKQADTAPFEEETASYTNLSASVLFDLPVEEGTWHLVIGGENLLDEDIRRHTSPIKDVAPSPGRSVRINLAVTF